MQVVIIEPQLRNQGGHQYSYTIAFQSELEKRNIPTIILGNISAEQECLRIKNFYPCLSDIISEVFAAVATPTILYKIYKSIKLLRDQIDSFFLNQFNFRDARNTVFFLHSPYLFELLSFGWFLKKHKKIFIDNSHKVFIGFNFSYKRWSLLETAVFVFLYKYVFAQLVRDLESQIIYFSDAEPMNRHYEQLFKRKINILPVPINNKFLEFYIDTKGGNANREKITMSFVGGARYNKGFDILVNMLEQLLAEPKLNKKIMLNIQLDIHRQQLRWDRKIILQATQKLENISGRCKNIKLIYGALPIDGYYNLLSESDVVILPYRSIPFKYVTSSIFSETVILGKIPVVASNTTMSAELQKYNLGDLIFDIKDAKTLIHAIERITDNINDYKEKIKNLKNEWAFFYSAENLVKQLITLLS